MKDIRKKMYDMTQDDWMYLWRNCRLIVPKDQIDRRIDEAVERVLKICSGKIAFGWSGGKDSTALSHIMKLAGVNLSLCVHSPYGMMKPEVLDWWFAHKPDGCNWYEASNISWQLLKDRPELLFPKDHEAQRQWDSLMQWQHEHVWIAENKIDWMLYGRRLMDNNFTGKNRDGITSMVKEKVFNPIHDWSHAEVLATIRWYDIPLEPHYFMPNGFVEYYRAPWPTWWTHGRTLKQMFRFVDSHVEGVYERAIQEGFIK